MQSVDTTKMFHEGIRNIYYAIVFQILQYVGASQKNKTSHIFQILSLLERL